MVNIKFLNEQLFKIKKSVFLRNVITIFTGGVIAQIVPLLVEPLLTRIYSPSEFALLAQFISFFSLFAIISTARYELAIMLPSSNRKSVNIVALSFIITLLMTVISLLIVLFFRFPIANMYKNNLLAPLLMFVPISVFFSGLYQLLNNWAIRNKRFKSVSLSRILQSITSSVSNVFLGLIKWGIKGLLISYILGQFFSIISFAFNWFKKDKKVSKLINKKEIKEVAKTYSDFPKINSLHAFSDILQQSLLIFLLSYFFTSDEVGYYSRTFRLLIAPIALIGSSIGQVFYQKASSYFAEGKDIKILVIKNIQITSIFSISFLILTLLFAPPIFDFFLGAGWYRAGNIAQCISPWLAMNVIISPISSIPLIVGKQRTAFFLSILANLMVLASIYIGGTISNSIEYSLILMSIIMLFYYTILLLWYLKISTKR